MSATRASRTGHLLALLILNIAAFGQNVTGKITDSKQQPVSDAFIHLLNTNAFAFSDAQGIFILKNITAGTYTVSVSAASYAGINEELVVTGNGGELNVQLADAAGQLDAVIVTAQKKEESLQNIPVSISAIYAKQVQQYRLWNSKELTAIAPNFYSNNSGDDRNVSSVRGIVTTSYDPAVATYIDGVNQFSLDTYIAGLNDIERIEILRGPQGTLYGRNAMGGVINIITKQPSNNTNGFAELNIGNYGQQRYSAGIRTPFIKDKLFFGASVVFNKRDGYYTNQFNNTSFDKQQGTSGNY
ncbi:MAG TPA: TonB-dependent receptor plug domain-containing protein, partial [Panacibacter sp.]|nr:TonB-dependent receptor plug domain-containing protein [Panacibacter sp.]